MTDQDNAPVNPQYDPNGQQAQTPQPQQQQAAYQQQPQQFQQQPQPAAWQQPQPQAGMPQQPATWQQPQQQAAYQQPQAGTPQQQAAWQQPANPYQQQPGVPVGAPAPVAAAPKQTNTKAIAALICGILAIITSFTIIAGVILGIVAIVLGMLANAQSRDGKATAGFICGIIGVVLSAVMIVATAATISSGGSIPTPFNFGGASSSSSSKAPLYETVKDQVVVDDAVCTIKIDHMEIDEDNGNLYVFFNAKNNVGKSKIIVRVPSDDAWEVDGEKARCVCFTELAAGEDKDDYLMLDGSYLSTNNIEDIASISGVLTVSLTSSGNDMEYPIALF